MIFLADDLGHGDVGFSGHPFIRTPGIDRIAREGLVFNNAFCAVPSCSPARASLLTGLYPHQAGVGHMMDDKGVDGYTGDVTLYVVDPEDPISSYPLMEAADLGLVYTSTLVGQGLALGDQ